MATNPPYLTSQPSLTKLLNKIKEASTPEKFTMKGGSAKALLPFLKRIGFTTSDGTPTDWYREFRSPTIAGHAAFIEKAGIEWWSNDQIVPKVVQDGVSGRVQKELDSGISRRSDEPEDEI